MPDHNQAIGARVKNLRTSKKYTLKQLSEEVDLSIGFLSQLERGMSSIAIDSLSKIADVFGVSLSSFFEYSGDDGDSPVVHGFDLHPIEVSPEIIQFIYTRNPTAFHLLPRVFQINPSSNPDEPLEIYNHAGEEFMYVLEGIVTVYVDGREYVLYPGDGMHIHSDVDHNWCNRTNKIARLLTVNYPNAFRIPDDPR